MPRQEQRSGTNRPKGRTKEQLYNEAKRSVITIGGAEEAAWATSL